MSQILKAELAELRQRLDAAVNDPTLAVHVPPEKMIELVTGYAVGTRMIDDFVGSVTADDILGDIAWRLGLALDALYGIGHAPEKASRALAVRMRATARRALRADDNEDRSMIAEFEYGLDRLRFGDEEGESERALEGLHALPTPGELRRDALGNVWRVEALEDDDENAVLVLVETKSRVSALEVMASTTPVETPANELADVRDAAREPARDET